MSAQCHSNVQTTPTWTSSAMTVAMTLVTGVLQREKNYKDTQRSQETVSDLRKAWLWI